MVGCAAAVAGNARGLLDDAEFLLGAGRWARAYSMAVLAAEEWGKAISVLTLSFLSQGFRSGMRADDLRGLLTQHEVKNAGADLVCLVDAELPGVAGRVAGMSGLADELSAVAARAGDANAAKQRGLYADLLADGSLSLPSSVSEDEARRMIGRARDVAESAAMFDDPDAVAVFASLPDEAEGVAFFESVVTSMLASRQQIDSAETMASVLQALIGRLTPTEMQA